MKVTRTNQYKEMIKLSNAVKSAQAHLKNIKTLLDSPLLPIQPNFRESDHEENKSRINCLIVETNNLEHFCVYLKEDFEAFKPARFTDTQLKEMHYLRDAGLSIERLAKRFMSTEVTVKKYLELTKEKTQ